MAVENTGTSPVLFDEIAGVVDDLLSSQIAPGEPQVTGLTPVTDPLVADKHSSGRLAAFDPDRFDLTETSLLMRILSVMLGASGVGGQRKQETINRMASTLAGTSFLDLDGFWGALFGLRRIADEKLPLNANSATINPSTDLASTEVWELAEARDGKYRSRIEQLAAGFALGPTKDGIKIAATAVLNCEVDVVESWLLADFATASTAGYTSNTWFSVKTQYRKWGAINGQNWGSLALGIADESLKGQAPLGNRGEIIVIPGRQITEDERYRLSFVLDKLAPAGTMVTVSGSNFVAEQPILPRSVDADSVFWDVTSVGGDGAGRPASSEYTGEKWTVNSRIASVTSYAQADDTTPSTQANYQTVTFSDGSSHDYIAADAIADAARLARARGTSEGVAAGFPYTAGRFT